jgi:hypothetical protein
MTPRQYKKFEETEKLRLQKLAEEWHYPLSKGSALLSRALEGMNEWKLNQEDIPLIIKLAENPNYWTARNLGGAVDLFTHDCIHILLGRGALLKDEAFVIGYTMGSSKKMSRFRRNLFLWTSKYLYPEGYKFGEDERFVFNMAVMLGSKCETDLSLVNFSDHKKNSLFSLRNELRIDTTALRASYEVEKRIFTESPESQRLL